MPKHVTLLLDFTPISEYQRQIVLGANQFCREHQGYRVRAATNETVMVQDPDVIDGVLAIIESSDSIRRATRFNRPVVNVSTIMFPVPLPTVAIDNRTVGRLAAEHLLAQGYRSFAFHMESRVFFSCERQKGFAEVIKMSGAPYSVFDSGEHMEASSSQLNALTAAWIMELPKPLGMATHNDHRANALMDLCNDWGIKVPNEVGIIGVDDDPILTQLSWPNLSSVDPGAAAIGLRAAETLARILSGEEPPEHPIFLPPRGIVVRESTEPRNLIDERLSTALRFIRQHLTEEIGVDDLLEAVPASRRSLERLFQSHLGRSPAEEIRRARINHVKWLLLNRNLSLAEIADKCGFSSFRSFASAFRRDVGMSATAYRKRLDRVYSATPPKDPANRTPKRKLERE
jgi:LacI family transcriptional regulator